MDLEFSSGRVEIYTKESTKMTRETAMEKWGGQMEALTKVTGWEESSMGMGKWYFPMDKSKRGSLNITFSKEINLRILLKKIWCDQLEQVPIIMEYLTQEVIYPSFKTILGVLSLASTNNNRWHILQVRILKLQLYYLNPSLLGPRCRLHKLQVTQTASVPHNQSKNIRGSVWKAKSLLDFRGPRTANTASHL